MSTMVQSQPNRLQKLAEKWFLTEPLLFAAWSTHRIVPNRQIENVRVRMGRVEFNPDFLAALDNQTLHQVMQFETLRIILKHPYERRKPNRKLAWEASNLAIQECLRSSLPMPMAADRFGDSDHDNKYFEYYYNLLAAKDAQKPGGT